MSGDAEQFVALIIEDGVARITLCRPPMNPVSDAVLHQLDSTFAAIELRPDVIVVRIQGNERAFCAGADLKMVAQRVGNAQGSEAMRLTARLFQKVYRRLEALPALTIAEISGMALGGGLELALACDLRVVTEQATLGLPEVKVGLLPGAGGTQRLTQLCGRGVASRLILTGDLLSGAEAHRLGLAEYLAPSQEALEGCVTDIVSRTKSHSADAIRKAKECIDAALEGGQRGYDLESEGISHLMMTRDAVGRVKKFATR